MKEREYTFKIDKVKPAKMSKPEISKTLKEFSKINNNQIFTMRQYDKWDEKPISAGAISKIFGSWTEAMRYAGLKSNRNRKKNLTEMVEIFKDAWEHFDAVPSGKQLDLYLHERSLPYTYRVYGHTFGNIGRLVKNIILHQEGKISTAELTAPFVPKYIREPISPKTRFEVLKRDDNKCVKCGASPSKSNKVKLEIDHILPVAKGGNNEIENLRTLCHKCNIGKSDNAD